MLQSNDSPPTNGTNPVQPPLLEMRAITKRFPGVLALNEVDFDVRTGEVHALVGENGAGKSTLMKILSGVYERDAGEVIYKGQPAAFRNPRQSQLAGITTIYQELNQVPYLSVTENIFLGSEPTHGGVALKWSEMHRQARSLLAKLHLDIDPRTHVGELGVGMQQMVEVAKALYHKADLIIMDEPTSSLSIREIRDLFNIVRELKAEGVSVIYISHHLEEVFQISDRTTVLRDGRHISTQPTRRAGRGQADPADGRPRSVREIPQGSGRAQRRGPARRGTEPGRRGCATSASRSMLARCWGWLAW